MYLYIRIYSNNITSLVDSFSTQAKEELPEFVTIIFLNTPLSKEIDFVFNKVK